MTTINDILSFTETFAPLKSAADFDNVGLLVGSTQIEVKKVMLALDITADVIKEAVSKNVQLIISHHPVIFSPLKKLVPQSIPYLLAESNLSALCLHTNLDVAKDTGVNSELAKALSLENITFYDGEFVVTGTTQSPVTALDFAENAKKALNALYVTCTLKDKIIRTVAVSSGSGGDGVMLAKELGADLLITGEAHHHNYLESIDNNISLVVAGHFETEDVVITPLKNKLAEKFKDVEFIKSDMCKSPLYFV